MLIIIRPRSMNFSPTSSKLDIFFELSALLSLLLYGSPVILGPQLPPGRLVFYASMAVTAFIECVFGCFLIYGAFSHKPKHTVPWTGLAWAQSVTLLVLAVTGTVLLSYNQKLETTAEISTVISTYFIYARHGAGVGGGAAHAITFTAIDHTCLRLQII
ncbi:Uncharacterized protein OBRU01_08628 [Operophtera brumata]|uniref:Uncharacterized protein n=1 Tax=Operophtera brumata TaxID=104452 RepID=A0A0L7LHM2_OPEBR|nr:Uncharacterized protein OBRU01_08628 [Operophtera brumata]